MSDLLDQYAASLDAVGPEWLHEYDLDTLRRLDPHERDHAVALTLERLERGDPRAPRALAEAADPACVPRLRAAAASGTGEFRAQVAVALWRLTGDETCGDTVREVAASALAEGRLCAVAALRLFDADETRAILLDGALADPDPDVRATAATSLLMCSGLMASEWDSRFRRLIGDVGSPDEVRRRVHHDTLAAAAVLPVLPARRLRRTAMPTESATDLTARLQEVVFPTTCLASLANALQASVGALSPLTRIARPAGPADPAGMKSLADRLSGEWVWALEALACPGCTLAVMCADHEVQRIGQYAWPDADAATPGFEVRLAADGVTLRGPHSVHGPVGALLAELAGAEPAVAPLRTTLPADEFWAVLAMADSIAEAHLLSRAARAMGRPTGATLAQVLAAWSAGTRSERLIWAVPLFRALVPDAVLQGMEARLSAALASLDAKGLLTRLPAGAASTDGDVYVLGEDLDLTVRGLSLASASFGVVRSVAASGAVETLRVGGWRTPGGAVVADVSAIAQGAVELTLLGAGDLVDMLARSLGADAAAPDWSAAGPPSVAVPSMVSAELARQAAAAAQPEQPARPAEAPQPAASAAPAVCRSCGAEVRPGARFCNACGQPVTPANQCTSCGAGHRPESRFCPACGKPLS